MICCKRSPVYFIQIENHCIPQRSLGFLPRSVLFPALCTGHRVPEVDFTKCIFPRPLTNPRSAEEKACTGAARRGRLVNQAVNHIFTRVPLYLLLAGRAVAGKVTGGSDEIPRAKISCARNPARKEIRGTFDVCVHVSANRR